RGCTPRARVQEDSDPARADGAHSQTPSDVATGAVLYRAAVEGAPASVVCVVVRSSGLFTLPVLNLVVRRVRHSPHNSYRVDRLVMLEVHDHPLRVAVSGVVGVARIQIRIALPERSGIAVRQS